MPGPSTGAERVAHHGNTLPCEDPKNLACDSTAGPDDELDSDVDVPEEQSRGIAYKSGWFDVHHGTVDEALYHRISGYAEGVEDARTERREQEDRCANGCECSTVDRVVADNPECGVEGDDGVDTGPYPEEHVYVKFVVRRQFDCEPTEPDQFLQYLVEMLELPQAIETGKVDYWLTGAHVYGVDPL